MQTKIIYVYLGEGDSGVQTPFKLTNATESKTLTRLIADEGKMLAKGDIQTTCIDVENGDVENWAEVDEVKEEAADESIIDAGVV